MEPNRSWQPSREGVSRIFRFLAPSSLEIKESQMLPFFSCHPTAWAEREGTNKPQLLWETQRLLKLEDHIFLIFPSPNLLESASQHFSDCCSVESLAIIFHCSLELKQKCRFSESSVMGIDCSLFLPLVWEASELCLWKDRQANTSLKKR